MDCERRARRADARLALGVGLRSALLGGIAFAILELLATGRLYVAAVVLALLGALLIAELVSCVRRSDRMFERFVEGCMAGDFEQPLTTGGGRGFLRQRLALARAASALEATRRQREQQIQHLNGLLDTVGVALIVLAEDQSVTLVNRAARRLAGEEASRLEQLPSIGPAAAAQLTSMKPGERRVVRLASGQRVLAQCAQLSAAGVTQRLVSLQNIAGELDAAELKAWQDVLRVLAHEIMGSLTPIASLAESVRPRVNELATALQQDAGPVADIAEAVEAIARRSSGLVSFVGRYRRLAELPPPVLRPVQMAEVVSRIEALLNPMLATRGIAYACRIEPPDLTVQADRDLLEQLLLNLLHNAIEACTGVEQAGIEISASYRGEAAAVCVTDRGRGIDAAALERIFVPLFTTKPGGSGIGLSLARQIAHAHGGTLEAAAIAPHGAAFTLLIPAHASPWRAPAQ